MAGNREINEIKGTPQTYVDTLIPCIETFQDTLSVSPA